MALFFFPLVVFPLFLKFSSSFIYIILLLSLLFYIALHFFSIFIVVSLYVFFYLHHYFSKSFSVLLSSSIFFRFMFILPTSYVFPPLHLFSFASSILFYFYLLSLPVHIYFLTGNLQYLVIQMQCNMISLSDLEGLPILQPRIF